MKDLTVTKIVKKTKSGRVWGEVKAKECLKKQSFTKYFNIFDDQLDSDVFTLTNHYPFCGETILREILKESMHCISEVGIQSRRKGRLKSRIHNVKGAYQLWHIDTDHKLLKWYLIIFGTIDGYIRLPVSLQFISNNKASTVLACFIKGVHTYGLTSKVSSDKGRENVLVADYLIKERGPERGSTILSY